MKLIEKIERVFDGPCQKYIFITAGLAGAYYAKITAEILGQVLASAIINALK